MKTKMVAEQLDVDQSIINTENVIPSTPTTPSIIIHWM